MHQNNKELINTLKKEKIGRIHHYSNINSNITAEHLNVYVSHIRDYGAIALVKKSYIRCSNHLKQTGCIKKNLAN